jgi:hypothetical protein
MQQPRELTDQYRLEKILGSSRGGSILRATEIASGRGVAIKLINVPPGPAGGTPPGIGRFVEYAAALGRVRHPNLPQVFDSGITPDGGAFLVMERLEGFGFDTHAGEAGTSPESILPLLAQALAGLEELARHGLGHWNVCPENLFVAASAEQAGPAVKLIGLGTPLFHLGEPWAESAGARFRAPEVARPAATMPDWRADCYSLALTACNALGATVAFGEPAGPIVQMPLALSFELANDEALRQILERCLRQAPGERPSHAAIRQAFSLALGRALPGIAPAAAPAAARSPAAPAPPPVSDWRAALSRTSAPAAQAAPPWAASRLPEAAAAPGATAKDHEPPAPAFERFSPASSEPPPPADDVEAPFVEAAEPPAFGAQTEAGTLAPPSGSGALRPPAAPVRAAPRIPPPPAYPDEALAPPEDEEIWHGHGGGDSLLDFFDVPATLPDLPAAARGASGAAGGQPSAAEMAAELGLAISDPRAASSFAFADGDASEYAGIGAAAAAAGGSQTPRSAFHPEDDFSPMAPANPPNPLDPRMGPASAHAAAAFDPVGGVFAAAPPLLSPAPGALPAAFGRAGEPLPAVFGEAPSGAPAPFGQPAAPPFGQAASPPPPFGQAASPPVAAAAGPGTAAPSAAAGGDMLSAVDDLLGSLPPPPPQAPTSAAAAAVPRGGRSAASATPGAGQRPGTTAFAAASGRSGPLAALMALPRAVLLGAAAALVVVLAVGILLLVRGWRRSAPLTAEAAAETQAAPAPPPRLGPSAAARFAEAKSYLILGRDSDARVRQALHEMTFADQGELGQEGCTELRAMQQMLALAALETAPQDLANGLRYGDLGQLQTVVETASDRDLPPAMHGDFERAKGLVRLYEMAQAASARGDDAGVLERCREMEGLSRTLHDPLALRDKAAAALESEAAALARDGRYDEAVGRLDPLRRSWPERAGVKDLVKSYESAAQNEAQQLAILDSVPGYERRRKPSEALDLLRPLKPTPHLEARVQQAMQELSTQLAQLDAQPPEVTLRDGYALDYSRGQVVTLSFRVTDDYQVASVKMFARPEAGRMREMPLQKVGMGYTIEIPPSFHQNGTVDFYVVATDLSGHEGYFGTKEQPRQLKRNQGFERLIR